MPPDSDISAFNMSTTDITLSSILSKMELNRLGESLPKSATPFTKYQHLYQYTTVIESESIHSTPKNPIMSYVSLQFVREELATLVQSEGPAMLIWCKMGEQIVEFSKAYFMQLIKNGRVYTDMTSVRVTSVTW